MKIKSVLLFISIFILVGFTNSSTKKMKLEQLKSKSIIGDFDGDKKADTLAEIHTSEKENNIINGKH